MITLRRAAAANQRVPAVNTRGAQTRWTRLAVLLPALATAWPQSLFADSGFALDAQLVDAGSAMTIGNSCSRLAASIGQPAPGSSSGGGFVLDAGFWAIASTGGDDTLFFDGFEGCRP